MKKRFNLLLLATSTILGCSCVENSNSVGGEAVYSDNVENVNTGYSKVSTSLTYKNMQKHSIYTSFTPSTGDVKMLALPIIFTDSEFQKSNFSTAKTNLENGLFGQSDKTGWESVSSFYYKSSFEQLNISGTVADPYEYGKSSTTFQNEVLRQRYSTETLLTDALNYYKQNNPDVDLTQYDSDSDGYLDGVYLIYMAPYYDGKNENISSDVFWAWCTWTNNSSNTTSPNPGVYFWCSYYFLFEGYSSNSLDAHTFIHETGHMLGLDDYYSYTYLSSGDGPSPLGGVDMMDLNIIDHNTFSKFALGWVKPYLINAEGSLTINKSSTTGECFIIPTSSYNNSAFDEYLMVELFSPDNLNYKDLISGYAPRDSLFAKDGSLNKVGIRIYHVDARLVTATIMGNNLLVDSYVTNLSTLDSLSGRNVAVVAHSNTADGYDASGDRVDSYNYGDSNFRLIQAITPEGVDYSSASKYISNKSLFYNGGSINFDEKVFYNQFQNKKTTSVGSSPLSLTSSRDYYAYANNGNKFLYTFKIDDMSNSACKITFTKVSE